MQRWTVHLDGGPRRVNHAAVLIGCHIYSFGGYCTGENFEIVRPIDVHILNTGLYIISCHFKKKFAVFWARMQPFYGFI